MTESAFAFASSAMIPIGQASAAGYLTFRSGASIVAKEGISMVAGAGAQSATTKLTGNQTAEMVAGMVTSGVTAKGLNGIEAEANKLAKAPKGIDGVTEEAGNLAEDVGKAGKGLEGAAKGAESAAEDAGKVVESGSKADTKPYTNSRPSFRKGVVEEVWENAKGPDGLVRDPNTGEVINWTPGESRKGVWDMGHIPEAKYSEMHEAYMNGELTTKEFVDWYNDPANYRPELPSNNRSHKYE